MTARGLIYLQFGVVPFKVALFGAHTKPNFLALLEAFLELGFPDAAASSGDAVLISTISSNLDPFNWISIFESRKNSRRLKRKFLFFLYRPFWSLNTGSPFRLLSISKRVNIFFLKFSSSF
jgi:hypothetical protein